MKKTKLPAQIKCERVTLKRHDLKISQVMFSAIDRDRKRLARFLPWVEFSKSIRDTQKYIRLSIKKWALGELFDYGIYLQESGEFLGNVGVHSISWQHQHCEIGYWIIGDFEGHGYMTEAVHALTENCFKKGFNRIEIRCSASNKRSSAVPLRCGFVLEGRLRSHQFEMKHWRDTLIFGLIKSDLKNHKPKSKQKL